MRIVLCGNYGAGNLGDQAIHVGLSEFLRDRYPNCEIRTMGRGAHLPIGFRSFAKSLRHISVWRNPLREIKNCDLFILSGGLFTDEESMRAAPFWILHGLIAIALGKKVACVGISIGRMNPVSRQALRLLLSKSAAIIVRDLNSKEILDNWGIISVVAPDFALYGLNGIKQENSTPNTVLINLRPFKNYDKKLITIFTQFCREVLGLFSFNISLLPFESHPDSDRRILKQIFDQVSSARVSLIDPTSVDLEKIFQNSVTVISMRLHPAIIAMKFGVPVIPISYMQKVSSFWQRYKQVKVHDIGSMDSKSLMDTFIYTIQNSNLIKSEFLKSHDLIGNEFEKLSVQ